MKIHLTRDNMTTPDLPGVVIRCCHCRRRLEQGNDPMVGETNPESVVKGYWSCEDCFEGPQEKPRVPSGPDDIGPADQFWM